MFGLTGRVTSDMAGLRRDAQELTDTLRAGIGRDCAVGLLRSFAMAQSYTYGENPDARSHGEMFLHLLQHGVTHGSQFVIATHSPMLLALPGAAILEATSGQLNPVAWDDLEHVRVTRAFLNDPDSVLRRLRD